MHPVYTKSRKTVIFYPDDSTTRAPELCAVLKSDSLPFAVCGFVVLTVCGLRFCDFRVFF